MAISETRYLAVEEEGSWLDASKTAPSTYLDFLKEGFQSKRNLNTQPTVGHIEPRSMSVGKFDSGGPIDFQMVPDEMGHLLRMLMGAADSSVIQGATAAYLHTWGGPADIIPNYTFVINKDGLARRFISTILKKAVLKLVPGLDVVLACEFVSGKDDIVTKQSPTYTAYQQPFHFTGWATEFATVDNAEIQALEYTFERQVDENDFRRASQFRKGCHARGFKTTIKADLKFLDETEVKRFYDGATATTPADEIVPFSIVTTLTGLLIEAPYDYVFEITTPKCGWDTEKASMDENKRLVQNLTAKVVHDNTQGSGTKMTLINRDTDLT